MDAANLSRKQRRYIKREVKAQRYRVVALAGGGTNECFRRRWQSFYKQLLPQNGLVKA